MKRRKRMTPSTKPLARRTPMKCSKPLVNQAPLKCTGPVKAVNRERKRDAYARNYGPEADAVRAMPCLCESALRREFWAMTKLSELAEAGKRWSRCTGHVEAAHVDARGMGGCNGDGRVGQVPLCRAHHEEAGEARTSQRAAFEKRYGLDLRKSADDIAVGHPRPLGIRGLADRWAWWQQAMAAVLDSPIDSSSLSDHETDALHGWVRREADRETERRQGFREANPVMWDGIADDDPDALADHIATRLGGVFDQGDRSLARALLDAAVQR